MRNWAGLGIAGRTRELWEPRWLSSSSSRYSPCPWLHAVASALLNATTTTAGDTAADIIITSTIGTTAIETGKRRPFLRAWRGANPQRNPARCVPAGPCVTEDA